MTRQGIQLIVRQTLIALRRHGARTAFGFLSANLRRKSGDRRQSLHELRPHGVSHAIVLRSGRSDFFFFGQIFIDDEFAPIRGLDIRSIVDLGGNIGLASVWFLNAFPAARVLTVEANAENYTSLAANLGPYGSRSQTVHGAVWWRDAEITVVRRQNEGDAHVRERQQADDPAAIIQGWSIPSLMQQGGFASIDLLKMDVEGAELDLFTREEGRWLPRVRNLSIETHGPECEAALERAMRHYNFRKVVRGELTFCLDITPKPA